MHIEYVTLLGYRNFADARVNLREHSLIIGANEVGKSNFLWALRLLLDRSLSDADIDPRESDFHVVRENGEACDELSVTAKFAEVDKDAVLSSLKGAVSEGSETWIRYRATRSSLQRQILVGPSEEQLEAVDGRYYLKYLGLKFISSQRDLLAYIRSEKRPLLRLSREARTEEEVREDEDAQGRVAETLHDINESVRGLNFVKTSMQAVNDELGKLAHHHGPYEVRLETGAVKPSQFGRARRPLLRSASLMPMI